MKKYVIFGAGNCGKRVLEVYKDEVAFFIDNDLSKVIDGYETISVKQFAEKEGDKYKVIISSDIYRNQMIEDLEKNGIDDYIIWNERKTSKLYGGDDLISNGYLDGNVYDNENNWDDLLEKNRMIDKVNNIVENLYGRNVLFEHVEIETINRCNGVCQFCPINSMIDSRKLCVMNDSLFKKIIDELGDIDYRGRLALFSNNEPFLDDKIIERHEYARKVVPNARMHLFTNGTLLTMEKFLNILQYLDEMVIDNYNENLELISPCREIVEYANHHPEIANKVTIVMRKPSEILSTRGGDAPNRKNMKSYGDAKCTNPFKQIIIRPDGKISLCCNDPLGKNTLGDLTKEKLLDVWNGETFNQVRKCIYRGRRNWSHCEYCDTFNLW